MKSRLLLLTCLLVTASIAFAGDLLPGRPLRKYCHLPCYDYRTRVPSNPVSAFSFGNNVPYAAAGIGALVEVRVNENTIDGAEPGRAMSRRTPELLKSFQLNRSELVNHHCALAAVTMTISSRGRWTFHARANQNPDRVGEQLRPAFERYKQNRFYVDIRPVGLFPNTESPDGTALGHPQFDRIVLEPFPILKRQVAEVQQSGYSDDLKRYFHLLDRIEVHLSYDQSIAHPVVPPVVGF